MISLSHCPTSINFLVLTAKVKTSIALKFNFVNYYSIFLWHFVLNRH